MDKRTFLNSISARDNVEIIAIPSIASKQDRERIIRDLLSRLTRSNGKEIVVAAVIRG